MTAFRRRQSGFTLTELTIVLVVIAVIVAGIWIFVGPANQHALQQQLAEQLSTVVRNFRAAASANASINGVSDALTSQMVKAGAIPTSMVRTGASCTNASGTCVDGPWGPDGGSGLAAVANEGSFAVCGWTAAIPSNNNCAANGAGTTQFFAVELRGLTATNCIMATTQNSAATAPPGLLDVVINGTSIMGSGATTHSLPVQVNDAESLCAPPAGGAVPAVDFVYRAQLPAF